MKKSKSIRKSRNQLRQRNKSKEEEVPIEKHRENNPSMKHMASIENTAHQSTKPASAKIIVNNKEAYRRK